MRQLSVAASLKVPDDHALASDRVDSSLWSLFEEPQASPEPPRKKRRITQDDNPGPSSPPASVTVLEARINFINSDTSPRNFHRQREPIPVLLNGRGSQEKFIPRYCAPKRDQYTLWISRPHSKELNEVALSLTHPSDGAEDAFEDSYALLHDLTLLCRRPAQPIKSPPRAVDICTATCHLLAPTDANPWFSLRCRVDWLISWRGLHYKSDYLHDHAQRYLPGSKILKPRSWSPNDFYANVYLPDNREVVPEPVQARGLETDLYPFQRRAVKWLLSREGVKIDESGDLLPSDDASGKDAGLFTTQQDADQQPISVSHLLEEVRFCDDALPVPRLTGGILAEEMGLGKTVELIALILLHVRAGDLPKKTFDAYSESEVRPSRATLIITPPHILSQWQDELARHSPHLNVYHYQGLQKNKASERDITKHLLDQDVVLTTYGVISREIHYARKAPERNLRHEKEYQARRSPLVGIQWWRVCLDEAQMIESGVSNAAEVARLVPRVNAWAVSGTPIKKSIDDLLGLLIFLRYEPYCDKEVWRRLLSGHNDLLRSMTRAIALRHPKSKLRDELSLPPQKRVTINCSFTAIESQRYNDLYQEMCNEVGVDAFGDPIREGWNPDDGATLDKMRRWLTRLRTTCLHAEVGGRNRRALGTKAGPLRTVDEVLDAMIDQNETAMRTQQRQVLDHKVMRGHLFTFGRQPRRALEVFEQALGHATTAVDECRARFEEQKRTRDTYASSTPSIEDDSGSEDPDQHDADKRGQLVVFRMRLRLALEAQHKSCFFVATSLFQIKDNPELTNPDSDEWKRLDKRESECYDQAKAIRKELLAPVTRKTTRLIEEVRESSSKSLVTFSQIPPTDNFRGLESRKITQRLESLRRLLNSHSEYMTKWRRKLVDLLLMKLLDQEEAELTGEEYEETTKQQDSQYVLLESLRAGLADRQTAVTGQLNLLINHEMKQALKRANDGQQSDPSDKGPDPELFSEILNTRLQLIPPENLQIATAHKIPEPAMSLKGIMNEIRSLITSVQWQSGDRSRAESAILERELSDIQKLSTAQTKELDRLETFIDLCRSTMNQRLEFYRQLQEISDTVAPLDEEPTDEVDQQKLSWEERQEDAANIRLGTLATKQRFLTHLKAQSSNPNDQRYCVICQDQFEIGVLTVCGHQYCKDCISIWWRQHHSCPTCKKRLTTADFHQVTYKPQELSAQEEVHSPSSDERPSMTSSPSKSSIYSDISESTLNTIKGIDLPGHSYGVKIDMISRHLLWIRENDPGAKSVIFSQYRDFLGVLGSAFRSHKIGFAEISEKGGIAQFQTDPAKEAFLMHAKADSSGLNLVNATHVFLCEPLVNAAIELQAIARVHRIGQRRPTTVWMYLVSDTVEEAIYDISVSKRLAHMQRSTMTSEQPSRAVTPGPDTIAEDKLDKANSMELQSAPLSKLLTTGQSGGEVVPQDDLWKCLFGNPQKSRDLLASPSGPAGAQIGAFLRAEAADARTDAEPG